MAAPFSNHSLSLAAAPPATSTHSRPVASLAPSLRIPRNAACRCGGRTRYPAVRSAPFARKPFRVSFKVVESDSKTINGEDNCQPNESSSKDLTKALLTMEVLIKSYKEAILNGDERGVSDLEAAICSIEKEKNELFNKAADLTAEIASGKDKFLRINADFENFRKRSEKDRLNFTSDIQGEVIESLLPMVDSFEKAKQQIKPETEKEKKIDTSYQGIYKQFVETMRALRVSVVETVGKQFDPLVHEAVARVDSQKFKEGTIIQEVRRGFLLKDRLLRPALVKVSNGSGSKKPPPVEKRTPAKTAEASDDPVPVSDSRYASDDPVPVSDSS